MKEGYKLRILDYDNLLDSLVSACDRLGADPSNVDFLALRDKLKPTATPMDQALIPDGIPKAFSTGLKALDNWPELGKPREWGEDTVVVIDSLTRMSDAAFNYSYALDPGCKDPRQWFFSAQKNVRAVISLLTDENFATNVIVIAHVAFQVRKDGLTKGFPMTVGKALGPDIPTYFSSVALVESKPEGTQVKRTLRTTSTLDIDLANPAGFKLAPALPLETGLADFFRAIRS